MLTNLAENNQVDSRQNLFSNSRDLCIGGGIGLGLFLALALIGSVVWAKSRDPFERIWFTIETPQGTKLKGVAVLPKPVRRRPMILYFYGSGGNLINSGTTLRQLAELGMTAVAIEYDRTDHSAFDNELSALLDWLPKQSWAETKATAWIGFSMGAQGTLRFLLKHPERQPLVYVRVAGGLPEELNSNFQNLRIHKLSSKVLLVHGEDDEGYPVKDIENLAGLLSANGMITDLKILHKRGHGFEPDRALVFRNIGEYVKARLTPNHYQPEFPVTKNYPFVICVAPAFCWIGFWLWLRNKSKPKKPVEKTTPTRFEKILRCTALVVATVALAQLVLHLVTPQLAVSYTTFGIARKSLIAPQWTEDFDELAGKSYWHGRRMKTLLTHIELSNYNVHELVNWKLPKHIYKQYVLSPIIDSESDPELNWRRPLWEFFYPRIRKENDTQSAATIIARELHQRVTIDTSFSYPTGIESIWKNQITTPVGFERIYVATLRSIGVPAKLNKQGKAEFWTGSEWNPAPRPLVETWL